MPFDNLPTAYADLMTQHGFIPANHAGLNFEKVEVRDIFSDQGNKLDGWKQIFNVDRRKTIHVATDKYELIPNEVCYGLFENALTESELDLTDMRIGTDMTHGGGRTFRQYLLPAHRVQVQPGEDVALRIIMLNSYDGSLAFRGLAGAFNFVCANTAIFGNKASDFTVKHVGVPDMPKLIGELVAAAEGFTKECEAMRLWPDIGITDTQAMAVFKTVPRVTDAIFEMLTTRWVQAANNHGLQHGRNAWALYNVLTAWATHERARSNHAAIRFDREGLVRKTIDGKAFRELVA